MLKTSLFNYKLSASKRLSMFLVHFYWSLPTHLLYLVLWNMTSKRTTWNYIDFMRSYLFTAFTALFRQSNGIQNVKQYLKPPVERGHCGVRKLPFPKLTASFRLKMVLLLVVFQASIFRCFSS